MIWILHTYIVKKILWNMTQWRNGSASDFDCQSYQEAAGSSPVCVVFKLFFTNWIKHRKWRIIGVDNLSAYLVIFAISWSLTHLLKIFCQMSCILVHSWYYFPKLVHRYEVIVMLLNTNFHMALYASDLYLHLIANDRNAQ